jgi:DNA-binding response OmpR family regulator
MEPTKILLAEDDPNLGMLLSKFIRAKGYACTLSVDGEEAYKAFTKDTFDFVILDLIIPGGMGGEETLRKLKEINPGIISLISSGYGEKFPSGFTATLSKPYQMNDMKKIITKLFTK